MFLCDPVTWQKAGGPGAAARLCDVRDVGATLQGLEFVGVPSDRRLRARRSRPCWRAIDPTPDPPSLYLAYPNNPTANLWKAARHGRRSSTPPARSGAWW
jgi:hypothetical protein